jgi:trimethylamine:corrinoid methyltransferase-like protein
VSDETLCVDVINDLEFCEKGTYLESEHTLRHFREIVWDTQLFDRTYRRESMLRPEDEDEKILKKADAAWRELVAGQELLEVDAQFSTELDRIVESARRELAG